MRKVDIRQLKRKLNFPVAKKILYCRDVLEWTGLEIYEVSGLPNNRQTEIVNHDDPKYKNGGMTERLLATMLERGFLTLEELKDSGNFTEKEQRFLDDNFLIYDDKELREIFIEIKKAYPENYKVKLRQWLREDREG